MKLVLLQLWPMPSCTDRNSRLSVDLGLFGLRGIPGKGEQQSILAPAEKMLFDDEGFSKRTRLPALGVALNKSWSF